MEPTAPAKPTAKKFTVTSVATSTTKSANQIKEQIYAELREASFDDVKITNVDVKENPPQ